MDKSSFFSIINQGHNTNRMKVPAKIFMYVHEDLWWNGINLISPSGEQWQVSTIKNGTDWYLQDGWPKFLTDNSVKHMEFLLFTYSGENRFQVQIFSDNGCERLCSKKPKQAEAAAAAATTSSPSLVKGKRGRPRKRG